jgi:hypothetical protein
MLIKVNKRPNVCDSMLEIWHDMTPEITSVAFRTMLMRVIQNQRKQAKGCSRDTTVFIHIFFGPYVSIFANL